MTRLRRAGHRVRTVAGASAAASTALAAAAVDRGDDAVVVLGGDGLLHHVLPAVAGTGLAVGIVPAGTGNDAATAFGSPAHWAAAVDAVTDALAAGRDRGTATVDLGLATAACGGARTPFATVLCWGFDAAVAELGARLPWPPGPRRYDVAIAAQTLVLRHRRVTIGLDDTSPTTSTALLVAVGNGGWYGGGKRMVPHAAVDDARLGVTVVGRVTRLALARLAPTMPAAGHLGHPAVTVAEARTVTLAVAGDARVDARVDGRVDDRVTAWADGERVGPLPLTVTTWTGALTVLRPPWCRPPEPVRPSTLSGSPDRA